LINLGITSKELKNIILREAKEIKETDTLIKQIIKGIKDKQ